MIAPQRTTYSSEHRRLRPVLDKAREFDIATNRDLRALFEAGSAGFQIWCTPDDKPAGWDGIKMIAGAFAQPCEYVASVTWGWEETLHGPVISHLLLSTSAYALRDRDNGRHTDYENRPEDIEWAKRKVAWLFQQAGVPCLPIRIERE